MSQPLVSVLTPVHDRYDLLMTRCIPSVRKQTYLNIEHVIVVDSNRELAVKLRREAPDLHVVEINDVGHTPTADQSVGAYQWFLATNLAFGEYFGFLGDDDEYLPRHVEAHVEALEGSGCDFSISKVAFYLKGEYIYDVGDGQLALSHMDFDSIVARRSAFKVANLKADGALSPDFHMVWEWHEAGLRGAFVNEVTAKHHDGWLANWPDIEGLKQLGMQQRVMA